MLPLSHTLILVDLGVIVYCIGNSKVHQHASRGTRSTLCKSGVPEAAILAIMWWVQFSAIGYADGGGGKSRPKSGNMMLTGK